MAGENKLGERFRRFREALNLSKEELGVKSGVDIRMIDMLERGVAVPPIGALYKLATSLGHRLGTFMDDQYEPDPCICRASEGVSMNGVRLLAHGKPDRHMDPYWIELDEKGSPWGMSFEGEFCIVVIDGEVELTYGDKTTVLHAKDSVFFNSVVKHSYRALGGKKATCVAMHYLPM